MANNRTSWSSHLGFLLATIGAAIGLGNIWSFPYRMASNGGFAFLLLYILLAFGIGYVLILAELVIGRMSQRGPLTAFTHLGKSNRCSIFGVFAYLGGFFLLSYYVVLGGYCLRYLVLNFLDIFGVGAGSMGYSGAELFLFVLRSQFGSAFFMLLFIGLNYLVLVGGIQAGIERFSRWAMATLVVMLGIIMVRSLSLPGADKAIEFMFKPNFAPLKEDFLGVLSIAACQVFLSLSVGMGVILTYGSYLSKNIKLETSAISVVIADTLFSILVGLVVIPSAMVLGGETASLAGPKLLFNTLQDVFLSMKAVGPWFGAVFYLLVVIAALTSSISLFEEIVTSHIDLAEKKQREARRKDVLCKVCIAISLVAFVIVMDGLGENHFYNPFITWFGKQPWNNSWQTIFGFIDEVLFIPIASLLLCLFVGYILPREEIAAEVRQCGNTFRTERFFRFCVRYVTPALLLFIFWASVKSYLLS